MVKYKPLLDAALFHRNIEGKLIPHHINHGPQMTCPKCNQLRVGKDFTATLYGGQVVQLDMCLYCASKEGWQSRV